MRAWSRRLELYRFACVDRNGRVRRLVRSMGPVTLALSHGAALVDHSTGLRKSFRSKGLMGFDLSDGAACVATAEASGGLPLEGADEFRLQPWRSF